MNSGLHGVQRSMVPGQAQWFGGAVPSPFDCWLVMRSLPTLPYRMQAHCANAKKVAEVLQQRAAHLQEYALRKVTLAPGQQVRGYLYFPRYDAADALVVKAPVGTRVVPLEFAQVRRRQ